MTDPEQPVAGQQAAAGQHAVAGQQAAPTDNPAAPGEAAAAGTGHPRVDEALRSLAAAKDLPPAEQIGAYEAAHRTLQETLTTIDENQG